MSRFTIIICLSKVDKLERLIKSVQKQSGINVKNDVQCIIADTLCNEESKAILEKVNTQNFNSFITISCENKSTMSCLKEAKEYITGDYVSIVQGDSYYSKKAFDSTIKIFAKQEAITMLSFEALLDVPNGTKYIYKIQPKIKQGLVNALDGADHVQLLLDAYFWKKDFLLEVDIEEGILDEGKALFILKALLKNPQYYYSVYESVFYESATEDYVKLYHWQHLKEWYTDTIKELYIPFLEKCKKEQGEVPEFIARIFVYLLFNRYRVNEKEKDKELLDKEEVNEFISVSSQMLSYIDYHYIVQPCIVEGIKIPAFLMIRLLENTAKMSNQKYRIFASSGAYYFQVLDEIEDNSNNTICDLYKLCDYSQEPIRITAINYENGKLLIDGFISNAYFLDDKSTRLAVQVNQGEINTERSGIYSLYKYFGQVLAKDYAFKVAIPVWNGGIRQNIQFALTINGDTLMPPVLFVKYGARLSTKINNSYWNFTKNKILSFQNNTLIIESVNKEKLQMREKLLQDTAVWWGIKCIALRKAYFKQRKKFENRRIWITFDRLYKGGDNGEYIFRYINEHCKNVEIYYLIKKNTPEYKRMRKECGDHVVAWGSDEASLLVLNAEVILAPHMSVMGYCGFEGRISHYFRDLFNAEIICIQHGLTVQKIAQWQNRIFDNIKLYCCASQNEIDNLENEIYGYQKKQLKLTGLARYDGLQDKSMKKILISPTWRRNAVNARIGHNKNEYNEFFKEMDYFKIYNSLINDPKLIETAKRLGYSIIYLLHPIMSSQIRDFEQSEGVTILAATDNVSYEKMMTEADVMVTDYSGIQFDFAYMRKPIVYYHPKTLPSHYDESEYFRYKEMGFGPIIDNHDDIIHHLCNLMEHNCKNSDEYVQRANRFFAFDDFNNCKRIYEAVEQYLKEKKSQHKFIHKVRSDYKKLVGVVNQYKQDGASNAQFAGFAYKRIVNLINRSKKK